MEYYKLKNKPYLDWTRFTFDAVKKELADEDMDRYDYVPEVTTNVLVAVQMLSNSKNTVANYQKQYRGYVIFPEYDNYSFCVSMSSNKDEALYYCKDFLKKIYNKFDYLGDVEEITERELKSEDGLRWRRVDWEDDIFAE